MKTMRKVMIGVKGQLQGSFNSMALMDVPTIKGSNLFVGDYMGEPGDSISAAVDTQEDWESYWKTLGEEPPGKLPANTVAIFQADGAEDRAVTLEPKTIVQDKNEITIEWDRMNIPHSEMSGAHSHYTVLLVPQGMLTANFMDTFPLAEAREFKKRVDAVLGALEDGQNHELEAPSKAMFMKKYPHTMKT